MDLRVVLLGGDVSPSDLADLALWLPAGCALWQDVGGPAALSMEQRELRRVQFLLRVLDYRHRQSKGEKPKPDPEPEYAHERRERRSKDERKADAYLRRVAKAQRPQPERRPEGP